ncbi:MAG: sugar ABC transporter permease [Ignavibacteria bacterium GWC2_56_12]|nr:MAG: sugar ABC transporter permease [Ignavibacteria bacterium GWC2_56_12]
MKRGLLYAVLIAGAVVFAYPFLWMFASSLKPEAEIGGFGLWSSSAGFHNYAEVFSRIPIGRALFNSIFTSTISTTSVIVFGSMVGYALARLNFRGRDGLYYLILFTMMVPFQVTLIPQYVLMVALGITDTYLAIVAPTLLSAFSIVLFRQFFRGIPQAFIDAARIDGCSEWTILRRIILPMARPVVVTVAILTFMTSWNEVLWPLIVVRERSLMTMPQLVTLFTIGGESEALLGLQLAAATLLALPIIVGYSFFQRSFIESMASAGIKG